MSAYIKAISYYLPRKILSNSQIIERFPEWTIDKIEKKIGIKERHISAENETASDMAVLAAENLFRENKIDRNKIDYLIFVTQSPDYHLPTTACIIQKKLSLPTSITAIDVNLGCSGFIIGLSLAKAVITSKMATNVLLLTAETYSKYLHHKDKGNLTIFGDASAATLICTDGFAEIGDFVIGTDGSGANNMIVKTGCSRNMSPLNDLSFDDYGNPKSSDYLYMDGPAILNYSLDSIPALVSDVLKKNNLAIEDIDLHIYHQANIFLADLERKKLKIPKEKYYCYIEKVGNTVSSTIPIALFNALNDGVIKNGYKILSVAQGLGYTWGGVTFKITV